VTPEEVRQFYIDVKDTFATEAGQRVFAWWRQRAVARLDPASANVSHFCAGRRVDFDTVDWILRTDLDDLLGGIREAVDRQQQEESAGGDRQWSPRVEDWLYGDKQERADDGKRQ
jgi:hypothetical protein